MKTLRIVLLLLLALAVVVVGSRSIGVTQAQGRVIVAFDMDTTGNTCPGTGNAGGTDCSLGSLDTCVSVAAGDNIDFDVSIDDIPSGENLGGSNYYVGWPAGLLLTINSPVPSAGAGETTLGVNLIADDLGSSPFYSSSTAVPNAVSPHWLRVTDVGVAEANPPFTQGVVHRFNATVGAATPPGVYGLFFDQSASGGPVYMYDKDSAEVCGPSSTPCSLLDANTGHGLVAVDTSCPAPVGGIAELPDASDSSGRNYVALGALAAAALLALSAGAWYVRRRRWPG